MAKVSSPNIIAAATMTRFEGYAVYPIIERVTARSEEVATFHHNGITYHFKDTPDFDDQVKRLMDERVWSTLHRTYRKYQVLCGGLIARSKDHGDEAGQFLFLPTSTKIIPPWKTDMVYGLPREGLTDHGKRYYYLKDWFTFDYHGHRLLEMLTGETEHLANLEDRLCIDVPDPELKYFYFLRAMLLVMGDVSFFANLALNPDAAHEYGCEDPIGFVKYFTIDNGVRSVWSKFLAEMRARQGGKHIRRPRAVPLLRFPAQPRIAAN